MDEQREGTWVLGCLEKPGWVISFPGAFFLLSQGDRKKRTRRSRRRREGGGGGGGQRKDRGPGDGGADDGQIWKGWKTERRRA